METVMLRSDYGSSAKRLARLDDRLLASAVDDVDDADLLDAARHHLAGGSRQRARLAVDLGTGLALDDVAIEAIGCCVELLHAASLVHDDLQDRAETRRGRPSVVARFGPDTALLLGDVLIAAGLAAAGELAGDGRRPVPAARARRAVARTASGQGRDRGGHDAFDLTTYATVAAAKSAPLFALPFELALAEAGRGDAIPRARCAARHFALAYQLRDDLDDVGDDAARGEANAVLVLEATGHRRAGALTVVARAARTHLAEARTAAAGLPPGAREPLCRLCTALGGELEAAWTR
jgi:geranylgeranyl diphosphate synthase type II